VSDFRGAVLACPACDGQLVETQLDEAGVHVDVCRACLGVWFDWFDGEVASLSRHLGAAVTRTEGLRPDAACPRDGAHLISQPYLETGPRVARCPSCLGLFALRSQIADLQRFHDRLPEAPPEPIERTSLLARIWHAFAG
jgi:hypothetical protein